jgi:hypothetical protein
VEYSNSIIQVSKFLLLLRNYWSSKFYLKNIDHPSGMFQFYAARKSRNMGRRAYATCKHIHGLERMHLLAGSIVMMIKALAAI